MANKRFFPVSLAELDEPRRTRRVPDRWRDHPDTEPSPLECEGCGKSDEAKFSRYLERTMDLDPQTAPAMLCDYCAFYGPPAENPLNELSIPELRGLEVLAAGGSVRAAAREMGVNDMTLRGYLRGEYRSDVRRAYQRLLLHAGVDPMTLATTLADGLRANKRVYDKVRDEYVEEPDHSNRLKAVTIAQKTLELEAPNAPAPTLTDGPKMQFNFVTNVGDGKEVEGDAYKIINPEVGKK